MTLTDSEREQLLRESGLAFAGRVTASVTHELNNVLSTVSELSGLLEDIAAAGSLSGALAQERLARIATGLTAQVKRGAAIVKRLNRFAHGADDAIQSVDVAGLIELIAGLADPLIRRHEVTLETAIDGAPPVIETNTFVLEQLLYLWIDLAASASDRTQPITVSCRPHSSGAEIEIAWYPAQAVEHRSDQESLFEVLAQELCGAVRTVSGDDGSRHRIITLPHDTEARARSAG